MRKRLYDIINGTWYGIFMVLSIVVSIIPLLFKFDSAVFSIIDITTTFIFIIDYIFRWFTADYEEPSKKHPFVLYPFRIMPIIDLVSILPSVTVLNSSFRLLKLFRLARTMKVFKVLKLARYSRSVKIIANVFREQKESLLAVLGMAVAYVIISALVVFNVEPDTFSNFFEAIYWATVSLTTMGYGDIYPTTEAGRIVTMLSSIFGIAIVALPAGIITAGYMKEIDKEKSE